MRHLYSAGVVVFRIVGDVTELLVLDSGNFVGHSKGQFEQNEDPQHAALRELMEETQLSLLVISQEPVSEITYPIFILGEKAEKTVYYFAGVANPHLEVRLSEEHIGYKWVDVRSSRRILTYENDKDAVQDAIRWLQRYADAAYRVAINMERLGF